MAVHIPPEVSALQREWSFCTKCFGLWWSAKASEGQMGQCPAGGGHQGPSWDFYLLADPNG